MAEIEANGQAVGGLLEPGPQEGLIREQNARRVGRRRAAAAAFDRTQRVSGEDLDRRGNTRKIGGRFETLQAVPTRQRPDRAGLDLQDLGGFLSALNFGPKQKVLGQNQFLSSFGPMVLGVNTAGGAFSGVDKQPLPKGGA